jgi:hypothetical protein
MLSVVRKTSGPCKFLLRMCGAANTAIFSVN